MQSDIPQADLLEELRIISGLALEKGNHCKELSEDIYQEIGERISWQSLRRVLGFIKSDYSVSMSVLDIIGRYLGFTNYSAYLISRTASNNATFTDSIFKHLSLVYTIPLKKEQDLNYHFVCRNISKSIYYQPELLLGFPNEFLSNRAFQLYFIERFPLIDLINRGLKGILIQYRESTDNDEANVFVGGLLYLNSFKSGLPNKKWLSGFSEINIEELHPLLQGRYFGSQLLSMTTIGKKNRLIDTVKTFLSTHKRERQFPFFIFTFIEYAIADKKFELVKFLLREYYNEDDPIDGWVEFGYREVFKVYKFIALAETQFTQEAILLSKTISKDRIAFYFRETFWIMYLKAYAKTVTQTSRIDAIETEIAVAQEFLYPTNKK